MLQDIKIREIAAKAASARVHEGGLERVITEVTTDSQGRDAVEITLVLTPEAALALTGENALNLLLQIHRDFDQGGDDRLPLLRYATETELAHSGGDDE